MSFVSLARRVILVNRHKKNVDTRESPVYRPRFVHPLPTAITERIPQELFERIIDHLYSDTQTLLICCLVCKSWIPTSRYHLFEGLLVRPLEITAERARVNCSVALGNRNYVFYGKDDGIYISSLLSRNSPLPVIYVPESITQIDVFEPQNLLVFLTGHHVMTIPLNVLVPGRPKGISACKRISSHVSFFRLGNISRRQLLGIVKTGRTSTCKLLDLHLDANAEHFEFHLYKEFYVSEKVVSFSFVGQEIVVGTQSHDYEEVDLATLQTQPFFESTPKRPKNSLCIGIFPIEWNLLVCYSSFAMYVDPTSRYPNNESIIRWRIPPIHSAIVRQSYILAFGPSHIEIWHTHTGHVQTVKTDYRVLSLSRSLPMIQTDEGRLLGLKFSR